MHTEPQFITQVYEAKRSSAAADALIQAYIPYIKKETSKVLMRIITEQDDEFSIALMAFHEAILSFEKEKGAFLSYAAMIIRSRLTDYHRKEVRHQKQTSIYEVRGEDEVSLLDTLEDKTDYFDETPNLQATQAEILELSQVLSTFGLQMTDIADNSPKQNRTLEACGRVVRFAVANPEVLTEVLQTKKLPIRRLADGAGVERKTLERHRRYILAMLVIQTNGYEIIRGHIKHVLKVRGGA